MPTITIVKLLIETLIFQLRSTILTGDIEVPVIKVSLIKVTVMETRNLKTNAKLKKIVY